jgi:hypothetical protein
MLNYKKASAIFLSVAEDLKSFADEGMIDNSSLIKIIQRCNSFLGLKLNQEKEAIIEISGGKAKLPNDFLSVNFILLCLAYKTNVTTAAGFNIEYSSRSSEESGDIITVTNGGGHEVVFNEFDTVKLIQTNVSYINKGCPNDTSKSLNEVKLKDGYIYTNFPVGTIYLNYTGTLEDEDGDLLVLDHPLIIPYYEYSCKKHLLENIYINGDDAVERRLNYINKEFNLALKSASLIVNTPEYYEIKDLYEHNRSKFHKKYYSQFEA